MTKTGRVSASAALSLVALAALPRPLRAQATSASWTQIGHGIVSHVADRYHECGRMRQAAWRRDDLQGRDVLWMGTSRGGLWRSRVDDNGNVVSWSPLTDQFPGPHFMGSFLVHSRDSHYILIGPGDFSGHGDGSIYRTHSEGAQWTPHPLPVGKDEKRVAKVWRIVDDRSDPSGNTVLASTDRGIYRSVDFGVKWVRVLQRLPGGQTLNVTDVVQDTGEATTWYAAAQTPHAILRSTDSGKKGTWKAFFGTAKITGSVQRVSLASCDSNPSVLYSLVFTKNGGLNGLYRTVDRGNTWLNIFDRSHNAVVNSGNQANHVGALACDPTNPDHVIFGVQQALETFNATAPPSSIAWRGCPQGKCHKEESTLKPGHGDWSFFLFRPHDDSIVGASDGGYYIYHPGTQTVDDSGNLLGI